MKDAQSIQNDLENVKLPAWQLDATTPDEYHCCEMRRGREFLVRMMTGADPSLAIARFAQENNIRFGRPEAPMDQVVAAAKAAEADEFIRQMPQGYNTIVGERGLGLSGGQKQRIAIARALLYDPAILVLDDSTSAVDMETEHEIQRHLKTVMKDRTTFIIAHRISSVKNADQILVLDKSGRIAERGTHDELLAKRGLYYDMYQDQYRDFESITSRPGFKITSAPKEVV